MDVGDARVVRGGVGADARLARRDDELLALADPYKVVCGAEVGWIVECRVTRAEMRAAVNDGHLLSEDEYAEVCDAQEREKDAAASRAYP